MTLAARGARDLGRGVEQVPDHGLADALRRRARRVFIETTVVAAAATLAIEFLPT